MTERICPYCNKTYIVRKGYARLQCCHRKACLKKHYRLRYQAKKRSKYRWNKNERELWFTSPYKGKDQVKPLAKCSKCHHNPPMKGNHFLCRQCFHYASDHLSEAGLFVC